MSSSKDKTEDIYYAARFAIEHLPLNALHGWSRPHLDSLAQLSDKMMWQGKMLMYRLNDGQVAYCTFAFSKLDFYKANIGIIEMTIKNTFHTLVDLAKVEDLKLQNRWAYKVGLTSASGALKTSMAEVDQAIGFKGLK